MKNCLDFHCNINDYKIYFQTPNAPRNMSKMFFPVTLFRITTIHVYQNKGMRRQEGTTK